MKKCSVCGKPVMYDGRYDAHFCSGCKIWLEPKCPDPDCEFCAKRPDKPLSVVEERK